MDTVTASCPKELLSKLREIDISVPPRGKGRDQREHCEPWCISRFLATFANSDLFVYPIRLQHYRERKSPDFLLTSDGTGIGIEVTEAVPENAASVDAKAEEMGRNQPKLIWRHRPNEEHWGVEKAKEPACGKTEFSVGWEDKEPEHDWAEAMLDSCLKKQATYAKATFTKFDLTWLLIYDNWPLPNADKKLAARLFVDRASRLAEPLPFRRIFVEDDKAIWQFHLPGWSRHPVANIWPGGARAQLRQTRKPA